MANCEFEMKVKATTEENLEKFTKILQYDDKESNLYRIFESSIYFDDPRDSLVANIYGTCARSVHTCMGEGVGSYYNDNKYSVTNKGTSLQRLTKELNLIVEVFSSEPGCGFMEHYVIDKGNVTTKDVVNYMSVYPLDYRDRQEAIEETGADISEEEWDKALEEDEYIDIGGIPWEYTI